MDRVKFMAWRRPKQGSSQTTNTSHIHHNADLTELEKRVSHLEEMISMGASMKDVQLVAQAMAGVEDALNELRAKLGYMEKHALTDVSLKKVVTS